jgi:hypothetical protein
MDVINYKAINIGMILVFIFYCIMSIILFNIFEGLVVRLMYLLIGIGFFSIYLLGYIHGER